MQKHYIHWEVSSKNSHSTPATGSMQDCWKLLHDLSSAPAVIEAYAVGALQGNAQFAEKVAQWQRKLGTVDVVLNTWAEVQKKWANLESIFVGSADIRVQLPEDSKRFDTVNTDFQACLPHALTLHHR